MKLTTVPSQIKPPRSEDWLIDGDKVGTISQLESGNWIATIHLDNTSLSLTCWVHGIATTREDAAANALRKLSMVSLHASTTYTKIVAGIA